jgi:hypothetical protein
MIAHRLRCFWLVFARLVLFIKVVVSAEGHVDRRVLLQEALHKKDIKAARSASANHENR